MKKVGNTVIGNGFYGRISKYHLPSGGGRRIANKGRPHITSQQPPDLRKMGYKSHRNARGFPLAFIGINMLHIGTPEAQSGINLKAQQLQKLFNINAQIIMNTLGSRGCIAKITWENNFTASLS